MPLKTATLIAIIGLSVNLLMGMLSVLQVVDLSSAEQARIYGGAQVCLIHLPLINFLVSLYLKQK